MQRNLIFLLYLPVGFMSGFEFLSSAGLILFTLISLVCLLCLLCLVCPRSISFSVLALLVLIPFHSKPPGEVGKNERGCVKANESLICNKQLMSFLYPINFENNTSLNMFVKDGSTNISHEIYYFAIT